MFLNFVANVVYSLGMTVVLALLAVFVVALWREPVERVSQTIVNAPAASWGVGVLTALAFVVVLPAFAVLSAILIIACGLGLLGFGVIAAASVALVIGWLMGWIALGQLVGQRLLDALGNRHPTPAASAAVGTAVITLFWLGLAPLCGMGWLIFAVLSPLGLGAVVLTRFGTQEYRTSNGAYPAAWSPAPAPVAPAAPAAPVAPEPPPRRPTAPEPPQFMPSAPEAAPSSERLCLTNRRARCKSSHRAAHRSDAPLHPRGMKMSPRKTFIIALVLLAVASLGCGTAINIGRFTAEEVVSKSFEVSGTPRVVVETFNGNIEVTTGAGNTVKADVTKRGAGSTQSAAQDDLKNIEVIMTQDGNTVRIIARRTNQPFNTGNSGAPANVQVPAGAILELRTSNGHLGVNGATGDVTARTSNGRIDVDGQPRPPQAGHQQRQHRGQVEQRRGDGPNVQRPNHLYRRAGARRPLVPQLERQNHAHAASERKLSRDRRHEQRSSHERLCRQAIRRIGRETSARHGR